MPLYELLILGILVAERRPPDRPRGPVAVWLARSPPSAVTSAAVIILQWLSGYRQDEVWTKGSLHRKESEGREERRRGGEEEKRGAGGDRSRTGSSSSSQPPPRELPASTDHPPQTKNAGPTAWEAAPQLSRKTQRGPVAGGPRHRRPSASRSSCPPPPLPPPLRHPQRPPRRRQPTAPDTPPL